MLRKLKKALISWILTISPYKAIAIGFAVLILVGAVLLSLPIASRSGVGLPFLDALFTATSATCVTGLIVVDTNSFFNLFGQIVLLCLIQIGGLGIMTIATLFSFALRRTITMKERLLMVESYGEDALAGVVRLTKHVLIGTLTFEGLGALVLSTQFIADYGPVMGIYKGIFHAVSSFCNAGFDLFGQGGHMVSLSPYVDNATVNLTIMALIIIGGLGFAVWEDLYRCRRLRELSLYTKLVLIMTSVLILGGALLFFLFEHANPETIGGLSPKGQALASFFQSVTTRTAGYETISQGAMTGPSKLLSIMLMFIGGSAGSTAGGIKIVTFGVLLLAVVSFVRGHGEVSVMKRSIKTAVVIKAMTVFMIALAVIVSGTLIISSIQGFPILNTLFEMSSAFGTVGLTTGITSHLNALSKIIVLLTMYAGRVGILTFTIALTMRHNRRKTAIKYPNERIII